MLLKNYLLLTLLPSLFLIEAMTNSGNCFSANLGKIASKTYPMFLPVKNILIMESGRDYYPYLEIISGLFQKLFTINFGNSSRNEEIFVNDNSFLDTLVLIEEESQKVNEILQMASRLNLFQRFYWLFEKDETVMKLLRATPLRLDSLLFTYECKSDGSIAIEEYYKIKSELFFTNFLGNFGPSDAEAAETDLEFIWWRRSNLTGVTLQNSVLPWGKYVVLDEASESGFSGMLAEVAEALQSVMNFTLEWTTPEDGNWGTLSPDTGQFDGMVGQLMRNEIDISTSGLTVTAERAHYIDYTRAITLSPVTLVSAPNSGVSMNIYAYVNIFSLEVWGVLLATVTIISAFFFLSENCAQMRQNFVSIYFSTFFNIVQLDTFMTRRTSASNLLFLTYSCTTCVIIFAYYNGVLTSLMTTAPAPVPIHSFEDVLINDMFVITWGGSAYLQDLEEASPDSAMGKVWKKVTSSGREHLIYGEEEARQWIKRDPSNVLYYGIASTFKSYDDVILLDIVEKINVKDSIGLRNDSEFKALFDFHISQLKEAGVLARINHKWLEEGKLTPLPGSQRNLASASTLGYENVIFPFLVLLLGVVISAVLILYERFIRWK